MIELRSQPKAAEKSYYIMKKKSSLQRFLDIYTNLFLGKFDSDLNQTKKTYVASLPITLPCYKFINDTLGTYLH